MTTVSIISGFLGAGKTTLIRKLLKEVYQDKQVVLIENEFGEIGIDGGFLKDAGIEITEMNSGCICCSLTGDFKVALQKVLDEFHPDHILIEPSGVGKLSDVKQAVRSLDNEALMLGGSVTVVDVKKAVMYHKNFGEFFNNQIEHANSIVFSRTQLASDQVIHDALHMVRELNQDAKVVTTNWDHLDGHMLSEVMETSDHLREALYEDAHVCGVCGCNCDDHEQHHEHDHHDHEHEHHHHHHADEVFTSTGGDCLHVFEQAELEAIVKTLATDKSYGEILRAKGMVEGKGCWYYFDVTPDEYNIREGEASYAGRYCVIGSKLHETKIQQLFEGTL